MRRQREEAERGGRERRQREEAERGGRERNELLALRKWLSVSGLRLHISVMSATALSKTP